MKVERKPKLTRETAPAIFSHAMNFIDGMLRCLEAHTVANTLIAAIPAGFVNGAFGLELLLKALRTGTGNPTGGHDLKLIFDGLPKDVQWQILIAYGEYTGDAPEIGYLKILAMAKTFETWRYLYEDLSLAKKHRSARIEWSNLRMRSRFS